MSSEVTYELQRKFSIIGLILVIFVIAGLTFFIFNQSNQEQQPEVQKEQDQPPVNKEENQQEKPIVPTETLFVLLREEAAIALIDPTTGKEKSRIDVREKPHFWFVDEVNMIAYVSQPIDYMITVVDLVKEQVIRKIEVNEEPGSVALAKEKLFVLMPGVDEVYIINPLTEVVERELGVGSEPERLLVTRSGSEVFVSESRDAKVSVINPSIEAVVRSYRVENGPFGLAIDRTGRYLYATNAQDNQLTIVPLRQPRNERTLGVGLKPTAVAFTDNSLFAVVANEGDNTISITSVSQEEILATIEVGISPTDIFIDNKGKRAFIANKNDHVVSVIDIEGKRLLQDIVVGKSPVGVFLKAE